MNYEGFLDYVKQGVTDIITDGSSVTINKVLKNNDIELDALTIMGNDTNISPTIYLNGYFEEYCNGRDLADIIEEIYKLYEEHRNKLEFDIDLFKDFDKVKRRLAYKVVNSETNEKLLKDVPHVLVMDLAIVFYCLFDNDYLGSATALIHNVHMDMWGISVEELYKAAKENTPDILSYEIKDMNQVIKEILISDIQNTINERDDSYDENCNYDISKKVADGLMRDLDEVRNTISMYVLTNKQKTNGAACMFYDGILKKFAEKVNNDIYILPSSVHEVILVPVVDGIDSDELSRMVKEVNKEELDAGDVLSDHVYFYDRDKNEILMDI